MIVHVSEGSGRLSSFQIRARTRMLNVFMAYACERNVSMASLRFEFAGAAVTGNDTARSLNLRDGDTLRCTVTDKGDDESRGVPRDSPESDVTL